MFQLKSVVGAGFVLFVCSVLAIPLQDAGSGAISSRITNGYNASYAQFPWHVSVIGTYTNEDNQISQLCGGSIISEEWILTAAHCVRNMDYVTVGIGNNNLSDPQIRYSISTYTMHDDYDSTLKHNDIALVRLPNPLEFSETIAKIKLPSLKNQQETYTSAYGTVCGFGHVSDNSIAVSQMLRYTKVEVIGNDLCREYYGEPRIPDSTMCAIGYYNENQNVCGGDSGGSLVVVEDGQIVIVGVIIFAVTNGCSLGYPAGFTRINSYMDWISEHTGIHLN